MRTPRRALYIIGTFHRTACRACGRLTRRGARQRRKLGDRTLAFTPTVFREGPTWDRLYQTLVCYWPDLLDYETKSSYTFPVIRLVPVA